jgi:hypothetical protein
MLPTFSKARHPSQNTNTLVALERNTQRPDLQNEPKRLDSQSESA